MAEAIQILIVDDRELVRQGFRALLAVKPGFNVVGEAADGLEAVELARTLQPDVILLDLITPRLGASTRRGVSQPRTRRRAPWSSPASPKTKGFTRPSRPAPWATC